jgi:hypothetical protein
LRIESIRPPLPDRPSSFQRRSASETRPTTADGHAGDLAFGEDRGDVLERGIRRDGDNLARRAAEGPV